MPLQQQAVVPLESKWYHQEVFKTDDNLKSSSILTDLTITNPCGSTSPT